MAHLVRSIPMVMGLLLFSSFCGAGEARKDEITDPVETRDYTVHVVDESGNPIAGAIVKPAGLRVKESPGSYYGWPVRNVGKAKEVLTDEEGNATFKFPPKFGKHPDWVNTIKVCFYVRHAEYIYRHIESDVNASPAKAELVPGCELIVSAIDPQRDVIENLGVMIAGNQPRFIPGDGKGVKRSRSIPRGARQTMLVGPREDGRHLFSNVLTLKFSKSKKVTLRGLRLRPGLEISGHLSDNVPRPIKNGVVISFSVPKRAGRVHDRENASLAWRDAAEIQPDGTFCFTSLPRTGKIHFIAICDGWLIDSGELGFFTKGVSHDLDELDADQDHWDDLQLSMIATGKIRVNVKTQDGKPLAGAELHASPNQQFDGGAQVLGDVYRSVKLLNREWHRQEDPLSHWKARYIAKTDENGVGWLTDLPPGSQTFNVVHDDYQKPASNAESRDRALLTQVESGQTTSVDVVVEPKPELDPAAKSK